MRRTQIYLTDDQLRDLKRTAARAGTSMADVIRTAIELFLRREGVTDLDRALDSTLGALPELKVPDRSEWDRAVG